jgi:hypothetical protein
VGGEFEKSLGSLSEDLEGVVISPAHRFVDLLYEL